MTTRKLVLLLASVVVCACTDDAPSSEDETAASTDDGDGDPDSGDGDPGDGDGDGDGDGPTCGNGVLDPDEECDDGALAGCSECDQCRIVPLLPSEWSIPAGFAQHEGIESIKVGAGGTIYARGTNDEGATPIVSSASSEGVAGLNLGPGEHGFDALVDHGVGPNDELVLLGTMMGEAKVRRMLADGSFEDPISVAGNPSRVALTEFGIATLELDAAVEVHGFDGSSLWTSPDSWRELDVLDGQLYVADHDGTVSLIVGDGSSAEVFDVSTLGEMNQSGLRAASFGRTLVAAEGYFGFGEVTAYWMSLGDGELMSGLVAAGEDGLEFEPTGVGLDANVAGEPFVHWRVCAEGWASASGCGLWQQAIGGPQAPEAVSTHQCDAQLSFRIGLDGGVFALTGEPGVDELFLVRRTTI